MDRFGIKKVDMSWNNKLICSKFIAIIIRIVPKLVRNTKILDFLHTFHLCMDFSHKEIKTENNFYEKR